MREAHTKLSKIYTRNWIDIKSGIVRSDSQNYILSLRMLLYEENKNVFNDLGTNLITISALVFS